VIIGGWRGPGWRVVDADPHQVRPVRDWIRAALSRPDSPVDPDEAALVASELYTNSVMHGPAGGRVLIGYCLWPAGARIVVGDGGGLTAPQVRWDAGLAEGGRGLQVIHALAAQWDSFRLPGAQVVWCDLGQPLRVPGADAWAWLHRVLASRPLAAGPTGRLPANVNLLASVTLGQVERLSVVEAVLAVGI
jgi:anti-sigma regulatory factor (Ser/Thr protein kinase)